MPLAAVDHASLTLSMEHVALMLTPLSLEHVSPTLAAVEHVSPTLSMEHISLTTTLYVEHVSRV
jgi:hypothetical protein